jgi:ribosomal protein S18 acetylase RimI-like enzyme
MKKSTNNNLERMIQLADEIFAVRSDPSQLSVNGTVMRRLQRIHPASITQQSTRHGPVAWILVIPTTQKLMEQFIAKKINERELYKNIPLHVKYDAVYLCSALVLPEYRRKGLAKRLMIRAIKSIQKEHPIQSLFYWGFSAEGKKLSSSVARTLYLPLYRRV